VAEQDGHRVTDLPGTPADFAAAETPEPVVLYRSLMTNPASTGSAYSAIWFPTGTMEKGSTAITGKVENA
jgi:hypothetical protein